MGFAKLFRLRSPDRDHGTDRARIEAVRGAIETVIAGIEQECAGLDHRIASARQTAGFLMLDDAGDAEGGNRLIDLEERLVAAERRRKELQAQVARFEAAWRTIDPD